MHPTALATRYQLDPLGRRLASRAHRGTGLGVLPDTQPLGNHLPGSGTETFGKTYRYDPTGELREAQHPLKGQARYDYDPTGRLEAVLRTGGVGATGPATRHPSPVTEHYAWDPAGNPIDPAQEARRHRLPGEADCEIKLPAGTYFGMRLSKLANTAPDTAWNGALQHGTRASHIPRSFQAAMPAERHSMRLPARSFLQFQRISLALVGTARVQSIREVRQAAAVRYAHGGKSGPRRAGCRLTAGRREATESATESKPPKPARDGKGEMAR